MKRTVCLSVLSLLGFGALGAQNAPEGFWTDPSVASEGKADSRPEFVSYSTREQAETGDPSRSPHYVSLEGKWRVRYSTMASGGERDFYLPSFSAAVAGRSGRLSRSATTLLPAMSRSSTLRLVSRRSIRPGSSISASTLRRRSLTRRST